MRRLLAAVVLVAGALLLGAAPARACDCSQPTDQEALAEADLAFVGTPVDKRFDPGGETWSSTDPATWVFEVDVVLRGQAEAVQELTSRVSGASCGIELAIGEPALVFARRGEAWLCNGTRAVTAEAPVPAALGERRPPLTPVSAVLSSEGATPTEGRDDTELWAIRIGMGAVVAVALGFALRAARR